MTQLMNNLQRERIERMMNKWVDRCNGKLDEMTEAKLYGMEMAVCLMGCDVDEDENGHYHITNVEVEE